MDALMPQVNHDEQCEDDGQQLMDIDELAWLQQAEGQRIQQESLAYSGEQSTLRWRDASGSKIMRQSWSEKSGEFLE